MRNIDLGDIFTLIGLILIGVGLYIYKPCVSFTVIGSIIFILGQFGKRQDSKKKR